MAGLVRRYFVIGAVTGTPLGWLRRRGLGSRSSPHNVEDLGDHRCVPCTPRSLVQGRQALRGKQIGYHEMHRTCGAAEMSISQGMPMHSKAQEGFSRDFPVFGCEVFRIQRLSESGASCSWCGETQRSTYTSSRQGILSYLCLTIICNGRIGKDKSSPRNSWLGTLSSRTSSAMSGRGPRWSFLTSGQPGEAYTTGSSAFEVPEEKSAWR